MGQRAGPGILGGLAWRPLKLSCRVKMLDRSVVRKAVLLLLVLWKLLEGSEQRWGPELILSYFQCRQGMGNILLARPHKVLKFI